MMGKGGSPIARRSRPPRAHSRWACGRLSAPGRVGEEGGLFPFPIVDRLAALVASCRDPGVMKPGGPDCTVVSTPGRGPNGRVPGFPRSIAAERAPGP